MTKDFSNDGQIMVLPRRGILQRFAQQFCFYPIFLDAKKYLQNWMSWFLYQNSHLLETGNIPVMEIFQLRSTKRFFKGLRCQLQVYQCFKVSMFDWWLVGLVLCYFCRIVGAPIPSSNQPLVDELHVRCSFLKHLKCFNGNS